MHRPLFLVLGLVVLVAGCGEAAGPATSPSPTPPPVPPSSSACGPGVYAVRYSDALDKVSVNGVRVGGLSAIAHRPGADSLLLLTDRTEGQPARVWTVDDPAAPKVTGEVVLRRADGTPYTGSDFDGEGLVVLGDGSMLVSSEREPTIRVFDRTGLQTGEVTVPPRFGVGAGGQGTANASLESLAATPDGAYLYTTSENGLTGDVGPNGGSRWRRIQVYRRDGGGYRPYRQIGYESTPRHRIAELAAYGPDRLLVLEAAFDEVAGNTPKLFVVTDPAAGTDVTGLGNLATAPSGSLVAKRLLVDLTTCPAPVENYEGVAVRLPYGPERAVVELVSDDNFSSRQTTRLLTLDAALP